MIVTNEISIRYLWNTTTTIRVPGCELASILQTCTRHVIVDTRASPARRPPCFIRVLRAGARAPCHLAPRRSAHASETRDTCPASACFTTRSSARTSRHSGHSGGGGHAFFISIRGDFECRRRNYQLAGRSRCYCASALARARAGQRGQSIRSAILRPVLRPSGEITAGQERGIMMRITPAVPCRKPYCLLADLVQ